jgi:hypothetical protein
MNQKTSDILMQFLANRAEGSDTESLNAIAGQEASDLKTQLLLQYLAQMQSGEAEFEDEEEFDDARGQDIPVIDEERHRRIQRKKRVFRRKILEMQLELEEFRRRNDLFAGALGACSECWGTNPACENCGGAGGPGQYEVDEVLFTQFVAPVAQGMYRSEGDNPAPIQKSKR